MFLTGFSDYAADSLAVQIKASRKLHWHFNVSLPMFSTQHVKILQTDTLTSPGRKKDLFGFF